MKIHKVTVTSFVQECKNLLNHDENIVDVFKQSVANDDEIIREDVDWFVRFFNVPPAGVFVKDVLLRLLAIRALLERTNALTIAPTLQRLFNTAQLLLKRNETLLNNVPYSKFAVLCEFQALANQIKFPEDAEQKREALVLKRMENALWGYNEESAIYCILVWPVDQAETPRSIACLAAHNQLLGLILNALAESDDQFGYQALNLKYYSHWLNLRQLLDVGHVENFPAVELDGDMTETILILKNNQAPEGTATRANLDKIGGWIRRIINPRDSDPDDMGSYGSTGTKKLFEGLGHIRINKQIATSEIVTLEDGLQVMFLRESHPVTSNNEMETEDQELDDESYDDYVMVEHDCTKVKNLDIVVHSGYAALNQIKNYQQYLYSDLSETERRTLIDAIIAIANTQQQSIDIYRACIYLLYTLLLGYELKAMPGLVWLQEDKDRINYCSISKDCDQLSIAYLNVRPEAAMVRVENKRLYKPVRSDLRLPVPAVLQPVLRTLFTKYYQYSNDKALEKSPLATGERLSSKQLIAGYAYVLEQAKLTHLSVNDISNFALKTLLRNSNADLWLTSVLAKRQSSIAQTQTHYATTSVRKLQQIYISQIATVFGEQVEIATKRSNNHQLYLGDYFRPVIARVNTAFAEMKAGIEHILQGRNVAELRIDELVIVTNICAIFIDQYIAYSCATRNKADNYVHPEQIDADGFTIINDKNIGHGYNTRLSYVTNKLQQELLAYESFKAWAIQRFGNAKRAGRQQLKCYQILLLKHEDRDNKSSMIVGVAYTRQRAINLLTADIRAQMPVYTQMKTNANRHYLRSMMTEDQLNGEFIDAYLGHWQLGAEPWDKYSLFDPVTYRHSIKTHITNYARKLHIPPLISNLQQSLSDELQSSN
jgi:hypothetical protein